MNEGKILEFCSRWLSSWTGNDPEGLIDFYGEDAFYSDPAVRDGIQGRDRLLDYFTGLLDANPEWEWEAVEAFPTMRGFTLKWKATIPVGDDVITEYGLDIVEIEDGKITRNEVYFDRTSLMLAVARQKREQPQE
ncbi:MAG: nuclear transport factor 2 family protein [Actinobacteria bacterium]|nr:nuclear transport factor 2 family protein [Actinomycetota bacterium]MCG2818412.1 nuclear transport factor 2 family protein [Actinomycetes bacterium]MBU4219962.1 nuclear transport factor 2 family protein [Actinomycetota bacterium]MBU4358308.1 nuclear transport factor 2 family protein [Actinomycetota bacterium]MBU4392811.1 nuclear transport factor 2 family protein [Actinomycetota bacterium]